MDYLFDDIERTFLGPSNQNEFEYDYYNRSARKDIATIEKHLLQLKENPQAQELYQLISDMIMKY